jgi:hypothetical protein
MFLERPLPRFVNGESYGIRFHWTINTCVFAGHRSPSHRTQLLYIIKYRFSFVFNHSSFCLEMFLKHRGYHCYMNFTFRDDASFCDSVLWHVYYNILMNVYYRFNWIYDYCTNSHLSRPSITAKFCFRFQNRGIRDYRSSATFLRLDAGSSSLLAFAETGLFIELFPVFGGEESRRDGVVLPAGLPGDINWYLTTLSKRNSFYLSFSVKNIQ